MDSRYDHFADEEMINAERLANEAKGNAELARLQWQEKMEKQLVTDVIETLYALGKAGIPHDELAWKAPMALKMLVRTFASGILYAQEKLG